MPLEVSMKVVGAGFGRTGTLSLKSALETLGVGPCYHMAEVFKHPEHVPVWEAATRGEPVDWAALFDGWGSAVDWPACSFYREILAAHPDAKVVLSVRDPERWYQSCIDTIFQPAHRFPMRLLLPLLPRMGVTMRMARALVWERTFGGRFADKAHAIEVFHAHVAEVKRAVPPDRLLVFEARDGWGPLCQFLGLPVPSAPYPHLNDTEAVRRIMDRMNAVAWALLLSPALALLAGLALALR